jgi:hypothetical protein
MIGIVVDLTPDEISELNTKANTDGLGRKEYGRGGGWYNSDTEDPGHLPDPLKQFLRDLTIHELTMNALHEAAIKEYTDRFGHGPELAEK